jgi:hypothetical protein
MQQQVPLRYGGAARILDFATGIMQIEFDDEHWALVTAEEALQIARALMDHAAQMSSATPLAKARLKAEFADRLWREAWNETIEASGAGADEKGMLAQRLKEFLASLNEEAKSC